MGSQTEAETSKLVKTIESTISNVAHDNPAVQSSWPALDELSSRTEFDALEVTPGGVVIEGNNRFQASATLYVTLNFGEARDATSMPDSYPALVRGHLSSDNVVIDEVEVDTSSYFGEDQDSIGEA